MAEKNAPEAAPMMALSVEQFQQLISAVSSAQSNGSGSSGLEKALENLTVMAKTSEHYAKTIEQQVRRSNTSFPEMSVFTFDPRCTYCRTRTMHPAVVVDSIEIEPAQLKHPKPTLKHETFFCNQRVRDEEITVIEAELYNSFEADKDARDGDWTATFTKKPGASGRRQLHVMVDGYQHLDIKAALPALVVILTELLLGKDAVDPTMVQAHMADMQKQIDALKAQLAVA